MIGSGIQSEISNQELGRILEGWGGRALTEGGHKDVKMVTGHGPSGPDEAHLAGVMEFASQIAHHFNNILSVMSGYGGLLKSKMTQDDPSLALVEKMLASSVKAHDLVRSLFLFTGDEKSRLREVDLNRVVKRAARFLEPLGQEKIKTKMELYESSLFVMADVVKMEEVLANLIENSRDAMVSGGSLTIRTEPLFTEEELACNLGPGFACLTVSDTGPGMEESVKARVFEPFFTTKGRGANVGLGLSKVFGIVKQHFGNITVESAPARGTAVKIRLPLLKQCTTVTGPIPLPDSVMAGRIPLCSSRWPV